jgi:hypothetical protein
MVKYSNRRTNSQLLPEDMTPARALGVCFGGGTSHSWVERQDRPNHWHATFDGGYANYLKQYFKKNGEKLGVSCYMQEIGKGKNDNVIFTIVTETPFNLVKRCMTASLNKPLGAGSGTVAGDYMARRLQGSLRGSSTSAPQKVGGKSLDNERG